MFLKKYTVLTILLLLFSVAIYAAPVLGEHEEPYLKKLCGDYDGEWSDGDCEFDSENKESNYKDYVCNDPKSDVKYPRECYYGNTNDEVDELREVCMSYGDDAEWRNGKCELDDDANSALLGFGDECEDRDFRERQQEFCKTGRVSD